MLKSNILWSLTYNKGLDMFIYIVSSWQVMEYLKVEYTEWISASPNGIII